MRNIDKVVAKNIKKARLEAGYTQLKLAKEANIDHIFLNKIENQKVAAGKGTIEAIARVLRKPISVFMGDPNIDAPKSREWLILEAMDLIRLLPNEIIEEYIVDITESLDDLGIPSSRTS